MKVIAAKFGIPVRFNQKYTYLNVIFNTDGLSDEEGAALAVLEDLVA